MGELRVVSLMVLVLSSIFLLKSLNGVYANSEVDALIAFKKSVSDPTNRMRNWSASSTNPPCDWNGISCDHENKTVVKVSLGGAGLFGQLSKDLSNLTHLEELNLSNNSIVGEIPKEFGSLSNLRTLDLRFNGLMGNIPHTLAQLQNLTFLGLSDNALSGPGPVFDLDNLTHLEILDWSSNNIDGDLSEWSWGNRYLPNLKIINLSHNLLRGSVPASWGTNINNIVQVLLNDNALSGPAIPFDIGNLTQLMVFDLSSNKLNGALPDWPKDIVIMLNALYINLSNNQLSGSVPASWTRVIPEIAKLDLTNNVNLTGSCTTKACNFGE